MLERLAPISLKCFNAAKQEARRLGSPDLNAAHLLLGLMRCQGRLLKELWQPYNVTLQQVADEVSKQLGKGNHPSSARLKVAPEVKAALRQGTLLAQGKPVMPTHLLAGLLESDQSLRDMLTSLGIDVAACLQVLQKRQETPPTDETPPPAQTEEAVAEEKDTPQAEKAARPTPTLDRYSRDLTRLAREGKLNPFVGREREMAAMIEILCRTIKRNPMLVGEPGVGKTALAEGLAQRIAAGQVPSLLRGKRLVELSISSLVAGAGQVGEFERRLQRLVSEVKAAGNVILFIDEAHALLGAGGIYGLQDAATILKPALARGDIVCIGATTTHEYRKYIEKDGALARRFQPVRVEEPKREAVLSILRALKPRFEDHFEVHIPDDLLAETYELAHEYLKNRYFPDKAIDLLERTASRVMLNEGSGATLTTEAMLSVISDMTGIPLEKLDQGELERYLHMEDYLRQRVIGQERAVEAVAGMIRLTKRRLDLDPRRPDGVFLFVGPPGVGKTEMAKALTEFLFGDQDRLIRLDMSEFSAEFTVSRLIGSPPGYVGYDEGGQLTELVRSHPFCVILLDDIEKAHPAVLNLFLQVFDDGRLTDAQGRTVYFADATIIMTSNLAGDLWFRRRMGFGEGEKQVHVTEEAVMNVLRRKLPPEFLSRVDEVVIFYPLDDQTVLDIACQKLNSIVRDRFARQHIEISFDEKAVRYVAGLGYDPREGCRRLERVIQREVLEPLAEQMYRPEWQKVHALHVTAANGRLVFDREAKSPPAPPGATEEVAKITRSRDGYHTGNH